MVYRAPRISAYGLHPGYKRLLDGNVFQGHCLLIAQDIRSRVSQSVLGRAFRI